MSFGDFSFSLATQQYFEWPHQVINSQAVLQAYLFGKTKSVISGGFFSKATAHMLLRSANLPVFLQCSCLMGQSQVDVL